MYMAHLTKKTKLFQTPFVIVGDDIYITDTKRAKRKFLKSGIKDVCFTEEFEHDGVLGERLIEAKKYDRDFLRELLPGMIESITIFFSAKLPYDEIVVFSDSEKVRKVAAEYAKLVSVVGEGKTEISDGMQIRYIKKIKKPPSLVITDGEGDLTPVFKIPRINLGENAAKSLLTMTKDTISFKTNLFPFDINADTLCYFLSKGMKVEYRLTSYRKKSQRIFTFG